METRSVYLLAGSNSSHVLLRDTLERLFRRKYRTFFLLFLWTAAMGAYVRFSPPAYEDEIQFFINNNRAGAIVTPEYNNGPVPRDYVDEAAVATGRQRDADRMRLARPPEVDDADRVAPERTRRIHAERADDGRPQAEARGRGRRDQRAAADRRDEGGGPQLLAAARQVRQPDEDQILEGLADGEQIGARHAPKV